MSEANTQKKIAELKQTIRQAKKTIIDAEQEIEWQNKFLRSRANAYDRYVNG